MVSKLLSVNSDAKTVKGQVHGYMTAIMYLEPDEMLCPHASKGCMEACLKSSGRMPMARPARLNRTELWKSKREVFKYKLVEEITAFVKKAKRKGVKPTVRLNGTSDIVWEAVKFDKGKTIFELFPEVQFYDYTPNGYRFGRKLPSNYALTYSLKEDNESDAIRIANAGQNVAVVFRGDPPSKWKGREVINGDEHDLRFLDKKGVIVGLKAKGKAMKDTTGFVQEVA